MLADHAANRLFQDLRQEAAANPRSARERIRQLLRDQPNLLTPVFEAASRPGEGRLRQLISNVVRSIPEREKISEYLFRWLETETDAFTLRSLELAVIGLARPEAQGRLSSQVSNPENHTQDIVSLYRYVAGEIAHRVRNALPSCSLAVRRLKDYVLSISDETARHELLSHVASVSNSMRGVGRLLEYDLSDEHFSFRYISILDWIDDFSRRFVADSGLLVLQLPIDEQLRKAKVFASDYHLEIIFWNLWKNAQDAVKADCEISITAYIRQPNLLELEVRDNGIGFPEEMIETAFNDVYSSDPLHTGRGLLEIADHVRQLNGSVELSLTIAKDIRVKIVLPTEAE